MTIDECRALANGHECPRCRAPLTKDNVFYSEDKTNGVRPTDAGRKLSFSAKCRCGTIARFSDLGIRLDERAACSR